MAEEKERKSKQFWTCEDGDLRKVTGYECPPNKDMWWVPELGYSLSVKYHLFKTSETARRHGIAKLTQEIAIRQKLLEKLCA